MKQLNSVENGQICLEVVECDCGFHLGIDATWLEQSPNSAGFEVVCPACNSVIPVDELTKPREGNTLIKKTITPCQQNYCHLFRKTCIKEECGAFTNEVPRTEMEMSLSPGPVTKMGMYCLRFKTELVPSYRHNDKGNLIRIF